MRLGDYRFKISVTGLQYHQESKHLIKTRLSQSCPFREEEYSLLLKGIKKDFNAGYLLRADLKVSTDNHGYLWLYAYPDRFSIKGYLSNNTIGHSKFPADFNLLKKIIESQALKS